MISSSFKVNYSTIWRRFQQIFLLISDIFFDVAYHLDNKPIIIITIDDVWEKKIQTWGFCSLIQVTIYFDDFISSTSGNFANNIVHFDKICIPKRKIVNLKKLLQSKEFYEILFRPLSFVLNLFMYMCSLFFL